MTAVDRPGSSLTEGASETELKFQLGQSAIESLNRHAALAEPGRRQRLRSIYFDTPEHDLRNKGFSLRLDESELGNWLSYFQICVKIARGVKRLHAAGLAHSDLSYKNVLIDPVTRWCRGFTRRM